MSPKSKGLLRKDLPARHFLDGYEDFFAEDEPRAALLRRDEAVDFFRGPLEELDFGSDELEDDESASGLRSAEVDLEKLVAKR